MKQDAAILKPAISLKEAIQLIEKSRYDTGFTLDAQERYNGTVTTSDLRRLLLSGVGENDAIEGHPGIRTLTLHEGDLKNAGAVLSTMADLTLQGLELIPVLADNGTIDDLLSVEDLRQACADCPDTVPTPGRQRRILIVGGAGYLGSVLSTSLLNRGYTVRILDNFLYGKHSLAKIPKTPALEIIEGDLRNIHTCVTALDGVHAVVLLAAIVGDPASKIRPRETIETNMIAAQALAAACRHQCIHRFLYASTCSVYGLGGNLLDEESELKPVSLYARTKIASEKTILTMGDGCFAPTILRMGTLYGYSPRMRFDLVVNTMTMHAFSEGRIHVFGGKQWRPLLSVQDAAEAYIRCIETDISKVGNQVFNIGSDDQNYQIEAIAGIIANTLGGIQVQYDQKSLDVRDYRVSFRKIQDAVGFEAADSVAAASGAIFANLKGGLIPNPSQRIYYNHFFDATEE